MTSYEDKVKQLLKNVQTTRTSYNEIMAEFHNTALTPKQPDDVMQAALLLYANSILDYLTLMNDFHTYYQGRKPIANSYTEQLLKIADKLETMLDLPAPPGDIYGIDS